MSKKSGFRSLFAVMVACALGVGALAYYVETTPQAARIPSELRNPDRHTQPKLTKQEPTETINPSSESVFLPRVAATDVVLSSDETAVPSGVEPKLFVAEKVAEAMKIEGVKVDKVTVDHGKATIDFSSGEFGMGSVAEGQLLKAFQLAFGQFEDVQNLSFSQMGQPLDTLGGHLEVVDPVSVIRPSASPSKTAEVSK